MARAVWEREAASSRSLCVCVCSRVVCVCAGVPVRVCAAVCARVLVCMHLHVCVCVVYTCGPVYMCVRDCVCNRRHVHTHDKDEDSCAHCQPPGRHRGVAWRWAEPAAGQQEPRLGAQAGNSEALRAGSAETKVPRAADSGPGNTEGQGGGCRVAVGTGPAVCSVESEAGERKAWTGGRALPRGPAGSPVRTCHPTGAFIVSPGRRKLGPAIYGADRAPSDRRPRRVPAEPGPAAASCGAQVFKETRPR